ncbi:hypothetical protein B0T24DRAFT_352578 [Lasiosphaeria ovina]|uniref:Uncharacterized protein n=1 Tax=Lasiosphaeria ovina TaxID=92902 RepID=A0AAE0K438_9PEZI|nr:hypothetical protein B0T24DRAFT_352578 [Lasiosphaeria ovina]
MSQCQTARGSENLISFHRGKAQRIQQKPIPMRGASGGVETCKAQLPLLLAARRRRHHHFFFTLRTDPCPVRSAADPYMPVLACTWHLQSAKSLHGYCDFAPPGLGCCLSVEGRAHPFASREGGKGRYRSPDVRRATAKIVHSTVPSQAAREVFHDIVPRPRYNICRLSEYQYTGDPSNTRGPLPGFLKWTTFCCMVTGALAPRLLPIALNSCLSGRENSLMRAIGEAGTAGLPARHGDY